MVAKRTCGVLPYDLNFWQNSDAALSHRYSFITGPLHKTKIFVNNNTKRKRLRLEKHTQVPEHEHTDAVSLLYQLRQEPCVQR